MVIDLWIFNLEKNTFDQSEYRAAYYTYLDLMVWFSCEDCGDSVKKVASDARPNKAEWQGVKLHDTCSVGIKQSRILMIASYQRQFED